MAEASEVDEESDERASSVKWLVLEKFSWGVPYENRKERMREVQERKKGKYVGGQWIGLVFMVSLYILRCGSGIIKSLREIRPLGSLTV